MSFGTVEEDEERLAFVGAVASTGLGGVVIVVARLAGISL